MAEDMIERAARAVHEYQYTSAWEDRSPRARDLMKEDIKVAFGAALDPEDEALVRYVREAHGTSDDFDATIWSVISAIRTYAQGER